MGRVDDAWSAVPGETPLDDRSGLRPRGIRSRAELSIAEAENIRKPTVKYLAAAPSLRLAPFTDRWAMRLHAEMFGDVWTWAGSLRTTQTNHGIDPWHIPAALRDLMQDVHVWTMPLIEQSALLHFRAVHIHPFLNGNGRWSRLLANIWLRQHDAPIIRWPEATLGESASAVREEYLGAIRAAIAGDLRPLIELHDRFARGGG